MHDLEDLNPAVLAARVEGVLLAALDVLKVDGVGLMLLDEQDELCLVGGSDEASCRFGRAQQRLKVGPCHSCRRSGRAVTVDDLAADETYSRLLPPSRRRGRAGGAVAFRGVVSAPVRAGGVVVGTLDVMTTAPRRWEHPQVEAVEAYANVLAVLLRLGAAAQNQPSPRPTDGE